MCINTPSRSSCGSWLYLYSFLPTAIRLRQFVIWTMCTVPCFITLFSLSTVSGLSTSLESLLADMALRRAAKSQNLFRSLSIITSVTGRSLIQESYRNQFKLTTPIGWINSTDRVNCNVTMETEDRCWEIQVAPEFALNLTFLIFNLEYSLYGCRRESLVIKRQDPHNHSDISTDESKCGRR